MFSQKAYALHSKSFWMIDRNDSQIQLIHFSISEVFKYKKKISKNSYVFGQIDKSILAKKKVTLSVFFVENFSLSLIC